MEKKRWVESRCDYSAREMRRLTFEKPIEIPIDKDEDEEDIDRL